MEDLALVLSPSLEEECKRGAFGGNGHDVREGEQLGELSAFGGDGARLLEGDVVLATAVVVQLEVAIALGQSIDAVVDQTKVAEALEFEAAMVGCRSLLVLTAKVMGWFQTERSIATWGSRLFPKGASLVL